MNTRMRVRRSSCGSRRKKCILIAGDVSNQKLCDKAIVGTVREVGALDVLMNNAAFQIHAPLFEDVTVRARPAHPSPDAARA